MRLAQSPVAWCQAREALQCTQGKALAACKPVVPRRVLAGRQCRQPEIQVAIQPGSFESVDAWRQPQAALVAPGQFGMGAGAGNPL